MVHFGVIRIFDCQKMAYQETPTKSLWVMCMIPVLLYKIHWVTIKRMHLKQKLINKWNCYLLKQGYPSRIAPVHQVSHYMWKCLSHS